MRAHNATRWSTPNDEQNAIPKSGIRITIADTGHGMSPSVLARVFEPFYTTKALNGTGLGLWISTGIVERHGGTLQVRSSENPRHRGTVFTLFLPYLPETEIALAPVTPASSLKHILRLTSVYVEGATNDRHPLRHIHPMIHHIFTITSGSSSRKFTQNGGFPAIPIWNLTCTFCGRHPVTFE